MTDTIRYQANIAPVGTVQAGNGSIAIPLPPGDVAGVPTNAHVLIKVSAVAGAPTSVQIFISCQTKAGNWCQVASTATFTAAGDLSPIANGVGPNLRIDIVFVGGTSPSITFEADVIRY